MNISYDKWINKGCPTDEDGENQRANEQHQRAAELVALNYHRRAYSILHCGKWVCRDRMCPRCSVMRSSEYKKTVRTAVRFMKHPVSALFKIDSEGLKADQLAAALAKLPAIIHQMRKHGALQFVNRAIGCTEVVPFVNPATGKRIRWNVHLHLIFDRPQTGFSQSEVNTQFTKLADIRTSVFGIEEVGNLEHLVTYITKDRDVCPAPGLLTLWELDQFMTATKGRQFLLAWGVTRRGKARRSTRPQSGRLRGRMHESLPDREPGSRKVLRLRIDASTPASLLRSLRPSGPLRAARDRRDT